MKYALTATFFLPEFMGGAKIAEVNVGRFNIVQGALEAFNEAAMKEPRLVTCVRGVLEFELNVSITMRYIVTSGN